MRKILVGLISLVMVLSAFAPFGTIYASTTPQSIDPSQIHSVTFTEKDLKTAEGGHWLSITPEELKARLTRAGKVSKDLTVGNSTDIAEKNGKLEVILMFNSPALKKVDDKAVADVRAMHDRVVSDLRSVAPSVRKIADYFYAINGVAITVDKSELSKVQSAFKQYGTVHVAKKYTVDGWPTATKEELESIGVSPAMFNSVKLIGADKAHEEGITGKGQIVAILDTGIRPDHEFFYKNGEEPKACTPWKDLVGPDKKFVGGYDFYENDDDPTVGPCYQAPNGHPHGTHVAGTVAGVEGKPIGGFTPVGVAPDAQLYIAKVFPDNAPFYASDVAIIAAVDTIVANKFMGMNIVAANMSLGAPNGFDDPNDPEEAAINTAIENGITFAISAGNEGNFLDGSYPIATDGIYPLNINTVGSPGTTFNAITVAASNNSGSIYPAFKVNVDINGDGEANDEVAYAHADATPDPTDVFTEPVSVAIADPTNLTACNADDVVDLTGKIALIKRGGCYFSTKIQNAIDKGAVGVIVYNHESGGDSYVYMYVGSANKIPAIFVTNSDGTKIYEALKNGEDVKVTFQKGLIKVVPMNPNGMGAFSSWGALPNLELKPDIAAPGVSIYSSVTSAQDAYASWNGTSMAAPHVAGAIALLKQKYPKLTPQQVKIDLMNHATPMYDANNPWDYSPRKQGAGRLNILEALHYENMSMVTTGFPNDKFNGLASAQLGNITSLPLSFNVKIHNGDTATHTYTMAVEGFAGATPGYGFFSATVSITPTKVVVAPGQDAVVTVNIEDTSLIGWIEGRVYAYVDGTEHYMVLPFSGLYNPSGPYYYGDPNVGMQYTDKFGRTRFTAYVGGANPVVDWPWWTPARYSDYWGFKYDPVYSDYKGQTGWVYWDGLMQSPEQYYMVGASYGYNNSGSPYYTNLWAGVQMRFDDNTVQPGTIPVFNFTAMRGVWDFKIDLYADGADYLANPTATPSPTDYLGSVFDWGTGKIRKNWNGYYYCDDQGCYYNVMLADLPEGRYVAAVYAKPQPVIDPFNKGYDNVPAQFVGYFPIAIDRTSPTIVNAEPGFVRDDKGNVTAIYLNKVETYGQEITGFKETAIAFLNDQGEWSIYIVDNTYVPNGPGPIYVDFTKLDKSVWDPDGDGNYLEHIKAIELLFVDGADNITEIPFMRWATITLNPGWNLVSLPYSDKQTVEQVLSAAGKVYAFAIENGKVRFANKDIVSAGKGYLVRYMGINPVSIKVPAFTYADRLFLPLGLQVHVNGFMKGMYVIGVNAPVQRKDFYIIEQGSDGSFYFTNTGFTVLKFNGKVFQPLADDDVMIPGEGYLIIFHKPTIGWAY